MTDQLRRTYDAVAGDYVEHIFDELKDKPFSGDIDWARVDAFRKYGGIRIEDDVVCTEGDPENLTRDAFALI